MTPADVLVLWFDAHARGDLEAARGLVVDDVEIVVPGARLHGFDSFMQWYRDRQLHEGASFGYSVEDLLGGEHHAAAVIRLSVEDRTWRQVALFRVEGDRIASMWAVEDAP
ncbi:MAG TPA: nuclear transport factor 2 family protein [Mycobacteriales bacterium]|nr:nuclear transport factor 2 family protein [Mycobacteriales bacterium]